MKLTIHLLIAGLGLSILSLAQAQSGSAEKAIVAGATSAARTDIYHVLFVHAVPGKVGELAEALKTPLSHQSMPGHTVVLRHQEGDSWDYLVISHFGPKFTLEAAGEQVPDSRRDLSDWHNDTLVNGPSWAEFSRALGLGEQGKENGGPMYVASTYRIVPGHRDAAEKFLASPVPPGDPTAGTAIFQHLEGAPWQYLALVRYNSWQDFATSEAKSVPDTAKKDSLWSQLRAHIANHTDTLCDRIMP